MVVLDGEDVDFEPGSDVGEGLADAERADELRYDSRTVPEVHKDPNFQIKKIGKIIPRK